MTKPIKLPPLPEPDGYIRDGGPTGILIFQREPLSQTEKMFHSTDIVWRSNAMQSYARAAVEPYAKRIAEIESANSGLERLCEKTYVAQGADAYNHACEVMEHWQAEREKLGKVVGTTGSLCDGIAWLYNHIDELEADRQANRITGETSDGYHTFNELYAHRVRLFCLLMHAHKGSAWWSRKHPDGSAWEGWVIAGIDTPEGSATYHLPVSEIENLPEGIELPNGKEWDGHTSDDVLVRLLSLRQARGEPVTGGNVSELLAAIQFFGSRKREEGAGLSDPKLQGVRSAWDEVYRLVQAVASPQPQQIPEGYRQILRDFFAALDKANALDKPSSAWANRPKGSTGERLQEWAEVNRLRAMLEAAPEPEGNT